MMKLSTIKNKTGNVEYNELMANTMELIKTVLKLNFSKNDYLFFLTWFRCRMIFLYKNVVIIAGIKYDYDKDKKPIYSTVQLTELYTVKLLREYPKNIDDIELKTIIKGNIDWLRAEIFLNWIDEPSEINEKIDEPYYKVIAFLQKYNRAMFSTKRYDFYSKFDNDSNFILNIYAYDKKNNAKLKIYIPDKINNIAGEWVEVAPQNTNDIVIDDLSKKLSNYQKLQCKKEFLYVANQENEYFKTKNYFVMQLLKLTIQPIDELHEWSIHRCFHKPKLFGNIFVYDFLKTGEEPYFFITDSQYIQETSKIAVLNFKNPVYHDKGIYKRLNVKRKCWKLNQKEIKELIKFLKAPNDCSHYKGRIQFDKIKKYVKTNWQQLIFEYNENTANWGWNDTAYDTPPEKSDTDYEALPFNLLIPDYIKLLNDR